jgi:hypothetical protein
MLPAERTRIGVLLLRLLEDVGDAPTAGIYKQALLRCLVTLAERQWPQQWPAFNECLERCIKMNVRFAWVHLHTHFRLE